MRDHPYIKKVSHDRFLGYDEAEGIVRHMAGTGDASAAAAVKEVDAARAKARKAALDLNTVMAGKLGLSLSAANDLVLSLATDPKLYTWLCRRVQLTAANDRPPADDEHSENA